MRGFGHVLLIGILAAVSLRAVSTSSSAQAPARDANAILAQAREALGGEKRLSAVKNFVATGRTRQVRGDNLVPIEFEISIELPDKYVRKDEIPAQEILNKVAGINVLDCDGRSIPFKSIYTGPNVARRVLVIFIRHFFCGVWCPLPSKFMCKMC